MNERLSGPPRKIFPNSSYIIQIIKSIGTSIILHENSLKELSLTTSPDS